MKGIDDQAAVEKARAANLPGFQSLVEQYSHDVFRLAFRITGNEMDAEDAVQETFLKAYQRLDSFDGRSSFGTWLYRVTANASIDVLRRRRRETFRSASLDDKAVQDRGPATGEPAPDRLVYSIEMNERIHEALDKLTELERAAFVMRHFENFRLDEIGRALGLRASATKQAVFRAVKKVRKTLEPVLRTTT